MSRGYYYLVASLPQLRLDDYKEPYRVNEFVSELFEHLSARHCAYVRDVLSVHDSGRIVDVLLGKESSGMGHPGNWSAAQVKNELDLPEEERDSYLSVVLARFQELKKNREVISRADVEAMVFGAYYEKMQSHENRFLRAYFYFDYRLRNILIALNKRKFSLSDAEFLDIHVDPEVGQLKVTTQNDFGLSRDVDYLPGLLEVFAKGDLLHSEKYIDQLRWQCVDDLNLFKSFEIDVLLGYLIKLMLVERWIVLDDYRGQEVLTSRTRVKEVLDYRAH